MNMMKRVRRILVLGAATAMLLSSMAPGWAQPRESRYLVGAFGVPDSLDLLKDAGLNTVFVRSQEVEETKGVAVQKVYVLGASPKALREESEGIAARFATFKRAGAPYDYYLADDVKCKEQDDFERHKARLGIARGMVGVLDGLACYPGDDILSYHYPMMRREVSLAEMLKRQVQRTLDVRAGGRRKAYFFVQTHAQFWYREVIKMSGVGPDALLYPDGQIVRMLVDYAIATGSNGYVLYDRTSLAGEHSAERVLGAAQAILETKPLYPLLEAARQTEYFQRAGRHGTIVRGDVYDVIFVFAADARTHHHPSTKPRAIRLGDVLDARSYRAIYQFSPDGLAPATDQMNLSEHRALVLVGSRRADGKPVLDRVNHELYRKVLQQRAEVLRRNLVRLGLSAPAVPAVEGDATRGTAQLLAYIDRLDEMKREQWERGATRQPIDGETLNKRYWRKQLAGSWPDEAFNFYYIKSR